MRDSKQYNKTRDTSNDYGEEDDTEIEMTNNDSALSKSNKKEEKAGQKFDIE